MRKQLQCRGLDVVRARDSRLLGRVRDVALTPDRLRVSHICVVPNGLLSGVSHMAFEDIVAFERTRVVVNGKRGRFEHPAWLHAPMLDAQSRELGQLHDFWFDEDTGDIPALQMSCGLLADLQRGRPVIQNFTWIQMDGVWVVWVMNSPVKMTTG